MKRLLFLIFAFQVLISGVNAQNKTFITGTVKDAAGIAVPFAFIKSASPVKAAYADSAGNFMLAIPANTNLQITAPGYAVAKANSGSNTTIQVIMTANSEKTPANAQGNISLKQVIVQNNPGSAIDFTSKGGFSYLASKKEDTKGSQYLFDYWVHGFVISPSDSITQRPGYLFNYDKIEGKVMLLQDNTAIGVIGNEQVKQLNLFDNSGAQIVLAIVPAIDKVLYTQILSSGNKYILYKLTKTTLQKADFTTNGITSHGDKFDSFIDELVYYIYNVQTKQLQPITLKKKSIKNAFGAENKKVDSFFDANSGDISDTYLSTLGDYMNQ